MDSEQLFDMCRPFDSTKSACNPSATQLRGGFVQLLQSRYGSSSCQASPDFGKRCQPGRELGRGLPEDVDSLPRRSDTSSDRAGQRTHWQDNLASWGADGGRGKEHWSPGVHLGSYAQSDAISLQRKGLGQTRDGLIRDGGGPSRGRVRDSFDQREACVEEEFQSDSEVNYNPAPRPTYSGVLRIHKRRPRDFQSQHSSDEFQSDDYVHDGRAQVGSMQGFGSSSAMAAGARSSRGAGGSAASAVSCVTAADGTMRAVQRGSHWDCDASDDNGCVPPAKMQRAANSRGIPTHTASENSREKWPK